MARNTLFYFLMLLDVFERVEFFLGMAIKTILTALSLRIWFRRMARDAGF